MENEEQDMQSVAMKVYNEQEYTIREISHTVEITYADIEECREYQDDPYLGKTDQDFLDYFMEIVENNSDDIENYPFIIRDMYSTLIDNVIRKEVYNSLNKSGVSTIFSFDKDGEETAQVEAQM